HNILNMIWKRSNLFFALLFVVVLGACTTRTTNHRMSTYADTVFLQDFSVKYYTGSKTPSLKKVYANQDGKIQLFADEGLYHLHDGRFLYPGHVVEDRTYRFMSAKDIVDMAVSQNQFIYLDVKAIFSNAWSGRLYIEHGLSKPTAFAANDRLDFLVTDGNRLHFIREEDVAWQGAIPSGVAKQVIQHGNNDNLFYVLTNDHVYRFSADANTLD